MSTPEEYFGPTPDYGSFEDWLKFCTRQISNSMKVPEELLGQDKPVSIGHRVSKPNKEYLEVQKIKLQKKKLL